VGGDNTDRREIQSAKKQRTFFVLERQECNVVGDNTNHREIPPSPLKGIVGNPPEGCSKKSSLFSLIIKIYDERVD